MIPSPIIRLAVCQNCDHQWVTDGDEDKHDCWRCKDGNVITTRKHPNSMGISLMIAQNPFKL